MLSKILLPISGIVFGVFVLSLAEFSLKWGILVFSVLATLIFSTIFSNAKKIFLTLMIIDMGLLIDKHFFSSSTVLASREGLQISITTISLIILYIIWFVEIITKSANRVELFHKTSVIALGYLLSFLLSMYNSTSISMSIFDIFFFLQMFMIYFYIANHIKYKSDVVYIVDVLLACLFIQSATILMQYSTRIQFDLTGGVSSVDTLEYFHEGKLMDVYRPAGTGGSPNEAGGHISMLLPIVLSLLLYTKNRLKNTLVWIALLMSIAALILTFSRGPWVGFAVGLVVFLFVALRHRWISGKKVVAMAVPIAMVLGVFSVPIAARLSQDDHGSAWSRVPLMKLAFNMIREHPFIGVGANNFGIVLPQYLSSELRGEWLHLVHNQYLLIFTETGVIGILFFLLIMLAVIRTCLWCIRGNDPILSPLSAGIVSGIISFSLFMTVELAVSRLTVQLFWVIVSIVMASERLMRINKQQFLNPSTQMKVESLRYERGFITHGSG